METEALMENEAYTSGDDINGIYWTNILWTKK